MSHTSVRKISYIRMQKRFNEDCVAFDLDLQELENNIPQSAWEMVSPNIAQDDRTTHVQSFYTLQDEKQELRR